MKTNETLFQSTGTLKYSEHGLNLRVEVDPEIVRYYRAFLPKSFKCNHQAYAPHISVVRKELPLNMAAWRKYDNEPVVFEYANIVYSGEIYVWLNAYCRRLEDIREELGLPRTSEITRPPSGWDWTFHITIGNTKCLN